MLCICLDDDEPADKNARARHVWHGDGRNRFYDKPLQFVLSPTGVGGFIGEHGMMDGACIGAAMKKEGLCLILAKLLFTSLHPPRTPHSPCSPSPHPPVTFLHLTPSNLPRHTHARLRQLADGGARQGHRRPQRHRPRRWATRGRGPQWASTHPAVVRGGPRCRGDDCLGGAAV